MFFDHHLNPRGLTATGFELSLTGLMTLQVGAGSLLEHQTGLSLSSDAVTHDFVAHPTLTRDVFIGLVVAIDDPSELIVWVDDVLLDGKKTRMAHPVGYRLLLDLGWFMLLPGATDLAGIPIHRRTRG